MASSQRGKFSGPLRSSSIALPSDRAASATREKPLPARAAIGVIIVGVVVVSVIVLTRNHHGARFDPRNDDKEWQALLAKNLGNGLMEKLIYLLWNESGKTEAEF